MPKEISKDEMAHLMRPENKNVLKGHVPTRYYDHEGVGHYLVTPYQCLAIKYHQADVTFLSDRIELHFENFIFIISDTNEKSLRWDRGKIELGQALIDMQELNILLEKIGEE